MVSAHYVVLNYNFHHKRHLVEMDRSTKLHKSRHWWSRYIRWYGYEHIQTQMYNNHTQLATMVCVCMCMCVLCVCALSRPHPSQHEARWSRAQYCPICCTGRWTSRSSSILTISIPIPIPNRPCSIAESRTSSTSPSFQCSQERRLSRFGPRCAVLSVQEGHHRYTSTVWESTPRCSGMIQRFTHIHLVSFSSTINIDGENCAQTPLEVEIIAGAFQIFTPSSISSSSAGWHSYQFPGHIIALWYGVSLHKISSILRVLGACFLVWKCGKIGSCVEEVS